MLKGDDQSKDAKRGSQRNNYQGPLASGLNRRAFLKTSTAISLLAGLNACKPDTSQLNSELPEAKIDSLPKSEQDFFSSHEQASIDAVQMHLFPDDGNGPSARDINAVEYLEWAMTDQQNIDDGDPEFIRKGVGWLDGLSQDTKGDQFIKLNTAQQDQVLKQIAQSNAGENWLSILMYYLTEALMLDPVYGGNPEGIGWQWLEHQAGFPRPEVGKTYRDFD